MSAYASPSAPTSGAGKAGPQATANSKYTVIANTGLPSSSKKGLPANPKTNTQARPQNGSSMPASGGPQAGTRQRGLGLPASVAPSVNAQYEKVFDQYKIAHNAYEQHIKQFNNPANKMQHASLDQSILQDEEVLIPLCKQLFGLSKLLMQGSNPAPTGKVVDPSDPKSIEFTKWQKLAEFWSQALFQNLSAAKRCGMSVSEINRLVGSARAPVVQHSRPPTDAPVETYQTAEQRETQAPFAADEDGLGDNPLYA